MANPRLCEFYGLPEPDKGGFQKVSCARAQSGWTPHHRCRTWAHFDGTRHRPVHRGVWVSEAFLEKRPLPLRPTLTRTNPILLTAPKPLFVKNLKLTPRTLIVRPVTKTLIRWD